MDGNQEKTQNPYPPTTSFFVYNLPSSLSKLELMHLFQHHKGLVDAYIPGKKDKYGNPFGFIRFKNLSNPHLLLPSLQNIKTNGLILSVQLAKSDRHGKPLPPPPPHRQPYHSNHPFRPPPTPLFNQTSSGNFPHAPPIPSYRDKLTNPNLTSIPTINLSNSKPKTPLVWRNSSIIATVKDLETLKNPKPMLQDPDFNSNINISYVGGLSILLVFQASALAKDFLLSKKEFLHKWFLSADLWTGQDFISGRITKIIIHGLPLFLWDKENFNRIANSTGKILNGSEASYSNKNLASSSVLVLVDSHKKIDNQVRITCGSKSFVTKISEEECDWCPPFFDDDWSENGSEDDLDDPNEDSDEQDSDTPMNVDGSGDSPIPDEQQSVSPVKDIGSGVTSFSHATDSYSHALVPTSKSPTDPSLIASKPPTDPSLISPPLTMTTSQKTRKHSPHIDSLNHHNAALAHPPNSLPPITPPPPPHQNPNPLITTHSMSRKRQRQISPTPLDTLNLDLNSPPPCNTAPPLLNRHSEFSNRYTPSPIPFETLLNQEFPPQNPTAIDPPPPPSPAPITNINHEPPLPLPSSTTSPTLPSFEVEIRETIAIGNLLGICLDGYEDQIAELISENRVNSVSQ